MKNDGAVYDLLREEGYIRGHKIGTPVDSIGRATAVAVELALRHGCPLETIRHALTKIDDNGPIVPIS